MIVALNVSLTGHFGTVTMTGIRELLIEEADDVASGMAAVYF